MLNILTANIFHYNIKNNLLGDRKYVLIYRYIATTNSLSSACVGRVKYYKHNRALYTYEL